jgi:hypothetical protein
VIFIDSFAGALSDMPKKHQKDPHYVLGILKNKPVFSVFDIDTKALAKTVDHLFDDGLITYSKDHEYPWVEAVISEKGHAFLNDLSSPQPTVTLQTNESN